MNLSVLRCLYSLYRVNILNDVYSNLIDEICFKEKNKFFKINCFY